MWTKFVKITPFKTLFFLLLLLTLIPSGSQAQIQMAAAAEAEQAAAVQTADDAKNSIDIFADEIKTEKKDKDKIQLNFNFFLSLLIDLAFLALIISLIYYPNYKRLDTVFTFVLFNVSIFLLTFLLNHIKISMGAAFGLFAVFSMLRYRTAGISVKDMTYLFIFITMGLLSGIQLEIYELLIIFGVLLVVLIVLDTRILLKREATKIIYFEDVELLHVDRHPELIEVLINRTGLNIHRITVEEISYLRDFGMITIYYYE